MNQHWPRIPLGEVLTRKKEEVQVQEDTTYLRITIKMHGKGIVRRDAVNGVEIGTKKQFIAREGQLILSKIDARNGAFGILPKDCDEAIITGNFWAFEINKERLAPEYFEYLTKTNKFVDYCIRASEGTTNRLYLQEDKFLEQEMPLPPLPEQRRLIGKLEQLASRTEDAKAIINKLEHESKAFIFSCVNKISSAASYRTMKKVSPVIRRPVDIEHSRNYPELGIRSFGKGTFHKPSIKGSELGSKRIFSIEPGDLLFSNVFAWEGAIAVAQPNDIGRYGSHRFITCVPNPARVKAEFLCSYFLTEEGIEKIGAASPGGAGRNRTLNIKKLETIEVPVPDMRQQELFCSLLAGIQHAKVERIKSSEAIESIIPSLLQKVFDNV